MRLSSFNSFIHSSQQRGGRTNQRGKDENGNDAEGIAFPHIFRRIFTRAAFLGRRRRHSSQRSCRRLLLGTVVEDFIIAALWKTTCCC